VPTREPFIFTAGSGRTLHGVIDRSDEAARRPTLVDCHGFKGFMEWGFHPYLAELLAARGFTVVRFNFASSGMRPGDELVTDEEAFATTPIGDDVDDLHRILQALHDGELAAEHVDPERLGLFGHSRGGGVSLLAAAAEPWSRRLRALVTWASVGTFDRIGPTEKEHWRRLGAMPVVNARTGQQTRLDVALLEDTEARAAEYDLAAAAARREAPWLLLHGTDDETVPVAEADALAEAAGGRFEIHRLEAADHTFGARHPFVGPTPHLVEAMNATQAWLRRHLGG
jgi:pimeloyl-ACP methyl ester carboxylesterase